MAIVFASFLDLTSGESNVLTLNPDQIKDGQTPAIASTKIPGTSHPTVGVGAGGSRIITFKLRIARTLELQQVSYVRDQVSWFRAVLSPYPVSAFQTSTWTPLQFKWGELYDLPVVLRSLDVTWLFFRGVDALPEFCDVDFQMEEISAETITTPEVRFQNKGFIRYL